MDSCLFLIFFTVLASPFGFTDGAGVIATLGEDSILPCVVRTYKNVTTLTWTRLDLDLRLLEFDKGKMKFWNSNYTERLELHDPALQNGNYSLVLRNVTREDGGKYECNAIFITEHSAEKDTYSFTFRVVEPGEEPGSRVDQWSERVHSHSHHSRAGHVRFQLQGRGTRNKDRRERRAVHRR